jgi:Domain of unknown function (DUF4349)
MAVPLRRTAPIVPVLLAAGLAIAACTSPSASSSASSGAASAQGAAGKGAAGTGDDRTPGAASAAGNPTAGKAGGQSALDAAAVRQRIVRTAQVVVQVEGELAPAAARVRAVAESLGGTVGSETTTYADTGSPGPAPTKAAARPGESVLVLRVREPDLDRALTLITGPAGVGRELSRSTTAQDVAADLADLQSRVTTQRASVTRVRALLAKATSLQDVVTLEAEVTKRESELEAAEARRTALADQADLATLTVDLRTKEAAAVVAEHRPNAFLDGLRSGWNAVTASTTVILTVLGALLPVAVVLAVLGAPVLWWLRRRRSAASVPPASAPSSPTPGAGT